jgi:hypothetical protein
MVRYAPHGPCLDAGGQKKGLHTVPVDIVFVRLGCLAQLPFPAPVHQESKAKCGWRPYSCPVLFLKLAPGLFSFAGIIADGEALFSQADVKSQFHGTHNTTCECLAFDNHDIRIAFSHNLTDC